MTKLTYSQVVVSILDRVEDKIQVMRSARDNRPVPLAAIDYILKSFRVIEEPKAELETAGLLAADLFYQQLAYIPLVDQYTRDYCKTAVRSLFDSIQSRGVDAFYVIDNEMPDDRYKAVIELFGLAGFEVITPNSENLLYEAVEKRVVEAMKQSKNIVYIEKDASINYIEKVLALSKIASQVAPDSHYVAALRNAAPSEDSNATLISRPQKKA